MLKISWKEKQTNENVLLSVEENEALWIRFKEKRKIGYRSYYEGRRTSKKCYRKKAGGEKITRKKAHYDAR